MQFWTPEMEKQVGERVQTVLQSPQLLDVYKNYGGEPFRRSSVFHGLGKFLEAQQIKGKSCFEIGTWNGLTAIVLSRFFDEVVSVDIVNNPLKYEILDRLGIDNVRFINVRDNVEKKDAAKDLEFDFAYLDGDHAHDTPTDWELTKHCGRVLFHEVWPFQQPVWNLVYSLPPAEVVFGGAGLALWRSAE